MKIIKESCLVCSALTGMATHDYRVFLIIIMIIQCLCRYRSVVARGIGVIPTSTNEAYGKVVIGEREEGYEMVKISHREPRPPPAKLEEMYEVPLSPAPPSQSLPTIPLPPTAGTEENTAVYEVISGDQ